MRTDRLSSRLVIGLLVTGGAALVAAFLLAPAALVGIDQATLPGRVGSALTEYWRSGGPDFPPRLAELVDYWFRWHALKVVISSLMLATFAVLAVALWRRFRDGTARFPAGALGAGLVAGLSSVLLIANVQATAVPLVALLPMLPDGDARLAPTLGEMRTQLREPAADSSALTVLVNQVARYHWVLLAAAAVAMVAAILVSARLWRRGAEDARIRRGRRALSGTAALIASLLLVVVVVEALSALRPAAALIDLISTSGAA